MTSLWKRIKLSWTGFLKKLSQANRETYGSGRPDCCSPTKKGQAGKRQG